MHTDYDGFDYTQTTSGVAYMDPNNSQEIPAQRRHSSDSQETILCSPGEQGLSENTDEDNESLHKVNNLNRQENEVANPPKLYSTGEKDIDESSFTQSVNSEGDPASCKNLYPVQSLEQIKEEQQSQFSQLNFALNDTEQQTNLQNPPVPTPRASKRNIDTTNFDTSVSYPNSNIEISLQDFNFSVLIPNANIPISHTNPNFPISHTNPNIPIPHTSPNFPISHTNPNFPISLANPGIPFSHTYPNIPIFHTNSNISTAHLHSNTPILHPNSTNPVFTPNSNNPDSYPNSTIATFHSKPFDPIYHPNSTLGIMHQNTNFSSSTFSVPQQPLPEYADIKQDLKDKLHNFPNRTAIPFYINGISRVFGIQNNDNHWKWRDVSYVRLPFSPLNKIFHLENTGGGGSNWDVIVKQLTRLKQACENQDIQHDFGRVINAVIRPYNFGANQKSNFGMLARPELKAGLLATLPIIVELALKLPQLVAEPIPILQKGQSKTLYLTRKLCSSLLANAFFCTFPPPSPQLEMPDYNFLPMYNDTQNERCEVKKEKIKCILNYFQIISQMDENILNEVISFERRCVPYQADWQNSQKSLCNVQVELNGKIEDAEDKLQVDFANKLIGGGVLNNGSVMEEISFCISPELIVSRLFTECMGDDEVVVITGSQRYSNYTGYSTSFKFAGPFGINMSARSTDNFGRTYTQIVAMDALNFKKHDSNNQFQKHCIDRELHKCYVAFIHGKNIITPVATGNWGCGAFNGNTELKFIIQWIAASHQDRPFLQYHTVRDQQQSRAIQDISSYLISKNVQVGQLYSVVSQFHRELSNHSTTSLFQFIKSRLSGGGGGFGGKVMQKFGFGGYGHNK